MIMVRGRRGLIMSIGFRQREGLDRGCPYVRDVCNWEERPALLHTGYL